MTKGWAVAVRATVLAWLALQAAPSGAAAEQLLQGEANGAAGAGATYRLADTWERRPWTLTAGRYGEAGDITSGPDGTAYILDTRTVADRPSTLHVLDPDGRARRVYPTLDAAERGRWRTLRLDAGADGTLYLLEWLFAGREVDGRTLYSIYRVRRTDGEGRTLSQFEIVLAPNTVDTDVAAGPDGRVYVTHLGKALACLPAGARPPDNVPGREPFFSVDVYDPDGGLLERIGPPELLLPIAVDVGPDGRPWVISHTVPPCPPPPPGRGTPTATAQPSSRSAVRNIGPYSGFGIGLGTEPDAVRLQRAAAPIPWVAPIQQASPTATAPPPKPTPTPFPPSRAVNGVLVFDTDHALAAVYPHANDEDIAVGARGAFVAGGVEIYAVHEPAAGTPGGVGAAPLWTGPTDQLSGTFADRTSLYLDVAHDGRLLASLNHCLFRGLVAFADPTAPSPRPALSGGTDAPELEGPNVPVRVAAADAVAVLLGRFALGGSRALDGTQAVLTNAATEAQTAQRWTSDGALRSQLGLCPDSGFLLGEAADTVADIAIDGDTVYTIDPTFLQARPDDAFPAWTFWPGERFVDDPERASRLAAVAADDGRAAVLDVGTGEVTLVDALGHRIDGWSLDAGGALARPVDIALGDGRVSVADVATGRVFVRDLAGRAVADWPLHDGPRAIAAAPGGDIVVLGRGGWGHHYGGDGRLLASWPMPTSSAEPRDIAVDRRGRVYVSFVQLGPRRERGWIASRTVERAGVWVFERTDAPPAAPPAVGGCIVARDKTAAPPRVRLGESVEVTLRVAGRCPDRAQPVDLFVLFDTSRSMADQGALAQAQSAVLTLFNALDGASTRVGLIAFADGPTLVSPLTTDIGAVARRVAALRPGGDTRLGGALDAARLAFERTTPRLAGTRRAVLIVTDGVLKDDALPESQAAALAALGVMRHALIVPTLDFGTANRDALLKLVAPGAGLPAGRVVLSPDGSEVEALARELGSVRPAVGALDALAVVDRVPANMAYVADSARPPALYDAAARVLTWPALTVTASEPLTLTYHVIPRQVGVWPTNVEATGDYRDALGHDGRIVFPIPTVEVIGQGHTVFLPIAVKNGCLYSRRPLDIVLVIDASSSMGLASASGTETKLQAARAAAATLVARLEGAIDRAAVVAFNHDARALAPLTDDRARIAAALDAITVEAGTRIDRGLDAARAALASRRPDAAAFVVLLSDGLQMDPPGNAAVVTAAGALTAQTGAIVYTIGLGAEIQAELLRTVASTPDRFYPSPDDTQLAAIYAAIHTRLICDQGVAP